MSNEYEDRVLILTPSGNDAINVAQVLRKAGLKELICSSLLDISERYLEGACCLLIAQEAMTREGIEKLSALLKRQEAWSDIPLLLITYGIPKFLDELDRVFGPRINLSLIERPLSPGTLISSLRTARRARQRQFELRDLLKDLFIAREEALVANRVKDEFLATVSHELRNPLNGILGFAQLLKNTSRSPQDIKHGLDVIERNARIQATLIDDLLDISRIVSGNMRLDMQRVDLLPVLGNAIESVRPLAQAKDIVLSVDCDAATFPLIGDAARLQQIIWNLLNNAIKFSRKGGAITIGLSTKGEEITLVVADEGIGISADFLPFVFDRFRQQDQAITRKKMGLGLGLSIVKHLVEMHSGSIGAASQGEGKGATFTVKLPFLGRVNPTIDKAELAVDVPAYEVLERDIPTLRGIKIIAVDDDEDSRALIKAVLEEAGAEVATAAGAAEAFVLMQSFVPHILLSDIGMPDEDGYSFIHRVRTAGGVISAIPAIALTAFGRDVDKERAMLAGFNAHISKPVAAVELAKITRLLALERATVNLLH